jgi:hypothetical protein
MARQASPQSDGDDENSMATGDGQVLGAVQVALSASRSGTDRTFLRRGVVFRLWFEYGRIAGYRLRFNLDGRPKGRTAPANICLDPGQEVWGVLYKITNREMIRLNSTEGVTGGLYRSEILHSSDIGGSITFEQPG